MRFLGYNPFSEGRTLAERLVWHRKALGLAQTQFARQLGVDPGTLGKWERGERLPTGRYLESVQMVLREKLTIPSGESAKTLPEP
jgi:DNA-binding transcriptional regulator YiaG